MKKQNTVVTIEKTSKRYKGSHVIGVCLLAIGLIISVESPPTSAFLILAGLVICIYARIGAWWNNG